MSNLVKTNNYRVLKPCPTCPFLDNGKAMHLENDRVDDIKEYLLQSEKNNFVCHKTVYGLDLAMNPGFPQERKMCAGAFYFLVQNKKPNAIMQIAKRLGEEKENIGDRDGS